MNNITLNELKSFKSLFDNNLKDMYAVTEKNFIYKLDRFEFEEVQVKKGGLFSKKTYETRYTITKIYFYTLDTPKGQVSFFSEKHYLMLGCSNIEKVFDLLIKEVERFQIWKNKFERIGLKLIEI